MKIFWKFTINIWIENSISDEVEFKEWIVTLNEVWYFYPHYFNAKGNITSYWAIIIKTTPEKVEYIKGVYKLNPNKILTDWKNTHIIFTLDKWISKWDYDRLWYVLCFLYWWEAIDYHFYEWYKVSEKYSNKTIDKNLKSFSNNFYYLLISDDKIERELSQHNFTQYQKTKKIPFVQVLTQLKEPLIDIDEVNDIHLKYWNQYHYVLNFFSSAQKVFEFFNKHFETEFNIEDEIDPLIIKDWVLVKESTSFFMDNFWYFSMWKEWEKKRITDFFIKVYYQIVDINWKTNYVVSLVQSDTWKETKKIIRLNTTSLTLFSDFIQNFWNYHFFGWTPFIKDIHKKITETKHIPIITSIKWYWCHENLWIIVFKNWIWDMKEKIFTEKKEEEDYYFNNNFNWYYVTDKQWNKLSEIINEWVASLNTNIVDMEDVYDFSNKLYKDDTWEYLILLAFGMMWYMLYWDIKTPFPLIFSRWITGSWKTSFNQLLQRIWWIHKAWLDFWNSTTFTLTIFLSNLIKFPYFLWEYRENIDQVKTKTWILRSVFDKSWQTKWRADQTIIKYDYYATPVIDWEEMIDDGAIRTRSLQKQFLHSHRIEWNFNQIIKDEGKIFDWVLYTYLAKSKWENYEKYIKKWYSIFNKLTSENRITENVALIYAGCMSFNPKKEEFYIKILSWIIKFQQKDFEENSTSMQIVKAVASYLTVAKTYINAVCVLEDKTWIVIDWNLFIAYVAKNRVELTLKVDSYKEHLWALWYPVQDNDTWMEMIYWIFIPINNIPKAFLTHPDIYSANKWYNLRTLKEKN